MLRTRRIIDNRVDIHSVKVSHIPSFWTIIFYGVLLMIVCCFVYKKITTRCFIKPSQEVPLKKKSSFSSFPGSAEFVEKMHFIVIIIF
nr:unnamed protein product [Callosobruchus chinensis]